MKHCPKCNTTKPITDFHIMNVKSKRTDCYCIACRRSYANELNKNPERQAKRYQNNLNSKKRNFAIIFEHLKQNPCEKCGETDPIVLEFDHLDQSTKRAGVAQLTSHSTKVLRDEIAKCRILCANCHRRHTAVQMDWYKNYADLM